MDQLQQHLGRLSEIFQGLSQMSIPLGAAAGLAALADLPTIAIRTSLTGNAAVLDALVICPGLHRQHLASQLNQAEYPAVAALTTGYVFRVENPATVYFLQRISKTGALTNLTVSRWADQDSAAARALSNLWTFQNATPVSTLAYLALPSLTLLALSLLIILNDLVGIGVLSLFIFSRLVNAIVISRRSAISWHGQPEPGVKGDLLVLLSQDRWVRLRGMVDDLKATTSGQWLRDPTFLEGSLQSATVIATHAAAGLSVGMSDIGKILLLFLLVASAGLLAIANEATASLFMQDCTMEIDQQRGVKQYQRRLDLVEDMLSEPDRNDEMMRLGLARMGVTVPPKGTADQKTRGGDKGAVTM